MFSHSRSNQSRNPNRFRFHGSTPFGNTTIVIGGGSHPSNIGNNQTNNPDLGTFFQTVLSQIVGGSQVPFGMQHGGGGGIFESANFDAFLTQFLNQMGENGGPAPASETRINSIPTVRVTAAQARDCLQCAICMDEFKQNDEAKRLPCSHHFHEECILRWLRMHGTCPTCRVTLDGDNTSNREYYNFSPNQQQTSSRNNNRRNNGGNNGSSSHSGSTLFDFD
ncbi:unnamed protein product [Rotaria sp. Silwood2]|nr:unnamed protein product [Rotaria sp. Silwood2]CAF2700304.1 unnamed protein product [Rotaria sp. Silwood2]CAF2961706.1 unnamed protein product [Rotaria sp. Silwood2]CAF3123097.1 unnamed protein product [Rotaria sp. Silwood2]